MPLECMDDGKPQHAAFDTDADNLIVWAACTWQSTAYIVIWNNTSGE